MSYKRRTMETEQLERQTLIGRKKFVRYDEGAELFSMGLHSFQKLAQEAGAIYRIRKIVLVNLDILTEYLETFREESL